MRGDSTKTFSSFDAEYTKYKASNNWVEIISLGETLLATDIKMLPAEQARLRCRLCSSYFYSAKYPKMIEHGLIALGIATQEQIINLQAKALYLISAGYRATSDEYNSRFYINQALDMTKLDIDPFIKGKIYFNAGALEQDLCKKYSIAIEHYTQAEWLFASGDDRDRIVLRRAQCMSFIGQVEGANNLLNTLSIDKNSRTYVHFLQTRAKVADAEANYPQALLYIDEALSLPLINLMPKDQERLQQLKQCITNKSIGL